jgi:tetratricopeptide (TPR) repeat protein
MAEPSLLPQRDSNVGIREAAARRRATTISAIAGLIFLAIYGGLVVLTISGRRDLNRVTDEVARLSTERKMLAAERDRLLAEERDTTRRLKQQQQDLDEKTKTLERTQSDLEKARRDLALVRGLVENPGPDEMRRQVLLALRAESAEEKSAALYTAAELALKKGDSQRAELLLRAALEQTPTVAKVLNKLGRVLADGKSDSEAEELYLRATKADPTYIYPFHNLAHLYLMTKRYPLARSYAEQALRIDPNYQSAKDILKRVDEQTAKDH